LLALSYDDNGPQQSRLEFFSAKSFFPSLLSIESVTGIANYRKQYGSKRRIHRTGGSPLSGTKNVTNPGSAHLVLRFVRTKSTLCGRLRALAHTRGLLEDNQSSNQQALWREKINETAQHGFALSGVRASVFKAVDLFCFTFDGYRSTISPHNSLFFSFDVRIHNAVDAGGLEEITDSGPPFTGYKIIESFHLLSGFIRWVSTETC
jgi:hypothetical protein